MSYKKWDAKFYLARLFFWHLIKRILFFWIKPPGLKSFLASFAKDAVYPVSKFERSLMPQMQKCFGCSLCTTTCEPVKLGKAPAGFEPKLIMLQFSRSVHESEFIDDYWFPCQSCQSCTVYCPNDVPIHKTIEVIKQRRSHLGFRK